MANQSVPGLNRGLSSDFRWLRSANHVKLTKECMMCTEKYILVNKKMSTNREGIGLPS